MTYIKNKYSYQNYYDYDYIKNKYSYQNYYDYIYYWRSDMMCDENSILMNRLAEKYKYLDDNNLFLAIKTKQFMIDDDLIKYLNYVNFIKCLKYVSKHKKFKLSVIIDKDIKKTLIKLIF
jgi:hypothetical protein